MRTLLDTNISTQDEKYKTEEKALSTNSDMKERLSVFVTEFSRRPERDYHLSLSDVVFFDMINYEEVAASSTIL